MLVPDADEVAIEESVAGLGSMLEFEGFSLERDVGKDIVGFELFGYCFA